jgi:hypothetical protein
VEKRPADDLEDAIIDADDTGMVRAQHLIVEEDIDKEIGVDPEEEETE